jgi:spermidine synthase
MGTVYGGKRATAAKPGRDHKARKRAAPARVRVQKSRFGRELIVDETFASFYRPGTASTGSVWDAIAAPLLALPVRRRRSVLLLGLGGGSAARLVRALAPESHIVGVEYDAEVVRVARRELDLDSIGIEIVTDDARAFLGRETRRFDMVIEDVFIGSGDDVHKPDWLPTPGHQLAARRVAPGGLLVSNALDEAADVSRVLHTLFPGQLRITIEDFDNRVFAAGPASLCARSLRSKVAQCEVLAPTLPALSFSTRRSAGS